jgi:hypothetical protein
MSFYMPEVNCLRELSHENIDLTIQRRRVWREMAQQRWVNGRRPVDGIIARGWKEITEEIVENLHTLASVLLSTNYKHKLVVGVNEGHVYTNDPELLQDLSKMPILQHASYSQARVTRPRDTLALKRPRHKYRSYFKSEKLTEQQKDHLMDFLHTQQTHTHVRSSPALQRWLDQPFNRTQDYFFVDYDSPSWLSMLALVQPGLVRKTMHIIPAK